MDDAQNSVNGSNVSDSSEVVNDVTYEQNLFTTDENIPTDNEWNVQEEWRDLNKNIKRDNQSDDQPKRKRAKPTCLDDCPEWDYIKDLKIQRQRLH